MSENVRHRNGGERVIRHTFPPRAVLDGFDAPFNATRGFARTDDTSSNTDAGVALHRTIFSASSGTRGCELWPFLHGSRGSHIRSSFRQQGIDTGGIVHHTIATENFLRTQPDHADVD